MLKFANGVETATQLGFPVLVQNVGLKMKIVKEFSVGKMFALIAPLKVLAVLLIYRAEFQGVSFGSNLKIHTTALNFRSVETLKNNSMYIAHVVGIAPSMAIGE